MSADNEDVLAAQRVARQRLMDGRKDDLYVAGLELLQRLEVAYQARFGGRASPVMLREISDCNGRVEALLVGFEEG